MGGIPHYIPLCIPHDPAAGWLHPGSNRSVLLARGCGQFVGEERHRVSTSPCVSGVSPKFLQINSINHRFASLVCGTCVLPKSWKGWIPYITQKKGGFVSAPMLSPPLLGYNPCKYRHISTSHLETNHSYDYNLFIWYGITTKSILPIWKWHEMFGAAT